MSKISEKIKKEIDAKRYPILHPNIDLNTCYSCCGVLASEIPQCSHYVVLIGYTTTEYICCILTRSNKFENLKVKKGSFTFNSFGVLLLNIFSNLQYYSVSTFTVSFGCFKDSDIIGTARL